MIRIAIAEDDPACAQQLCQFIETFGRESTQAFTTAVFPDGEKLVAAYNSQFDIILMDVEMPVMDGMTAAGYIRRMDPAVVIIFITNMAQYAIKGYEVDALDYVLKPVSYFSFTQRLNRAVSRLHARRKAYVALPVKGGSMRMESADLYYVESQGHQLLYHTRSGVYQATGTIQQAEQDLEGMGFFRCNKGYLVNLEHVEGIQGSCAQVKGESLLISRGRRAAFLEALAGYVGGTRR